jgi:hypothetical protein
MLSFLASLVLLGIIGGLVGAALRHRPQQGTLLPVRNVVSTTRLTSRMRTPMLGIGARAFPDANAAAGRTDLGCADANRRQWDDAHMA